MSNILEQKRNDDKKKNFFEKIFKCLKDRMDDLLVLKLFWKNQIKERKLLFQDPLERFVNYLLIQSFFIFIVNKKSKHYKCNKLKHISTRLKRYL